jgi:peptidoglycan LD-endopeptidase CwlK
MASRSLDDLRPEFRAMAELWLADCAGEQLDVLVYCSYRSMAEQSALYAQGRTRPGPIVTRAQAGESAHNFGLALDFVPLLNGKPQWAAGNVLYVQAINRAIDRGMESLCNSGRFSEWAHLQHPDWRALKDVTKV